jgi:hypothetical protein
MVSNRRKGCDTNPITDWGDTEALLATVRGIASEYQDVLSAPDVDRLMHALDAIASELEARHKREWEYHELWHSETDRAEAAEAELLRCNAGFDRQKAELERVRAERDHYRFHFDQFEARLDKAVEALRKIGLTPMIVDGSWATKWQEIARRALAEIEESGG